MLLSDNLNKYFDPSKKLDIDFDYFSSKVIGAFYMFDKNNVEIKKYVYNEIVKEWINIALILKKDNDLEAKEALDSYWGYFLK